MEPLFLLNVEDFDICLPNIKLKLMIPDENSQRLTLERLTKLFKNSSSTGKETIVGKLIKFDIISTLFDVLQSPCDRLLPNVLELFSLVIAHRTFYEECVVADSLDSMLKITICTLKSRSKETQLLTTLLSIIFDILQRATQFDLCFDAVCTPRQILHLLRIVIGERSSDRKLKFLAVRLLTIVIENANLEEYFEDETVFRVCHEALNSMRETVDYSDDDVSISLAADALCGICAACTRFCNVEEEQDERVFDKVVQGKIALTRAIYSTMMKTIVPYAKNVKSTGTDRVRFHRNLVTCLNNLYKLRNCSHDDLSNHLASSGCLKCFLLLTLELPENLRRSTCMLLSRIIFTLAEKHMSIEKQIEHTIGFSNQLYHGLVALPRNPEQWKAITAHQGDSGTALMILIYYHFHATRESTEAVKLTGTCFSTKISEIDREAERTHMISLQSLIERILNLQRPRSVTPLVLKPLWFLFAVASISHIEPNSEKNYSIAVKRLSAILQGSILHDCYTHHVDLLHYCLKCAEIPRVLRQRTMDLWLIESKGDIKPLLKLDCIKVVRHCLLIIVQTAYPEDVVNLAMKGIRDLMETDNVQEIAEIAWHMLPTFLSSYRPCKNGDERAKAILELANVSIPRRLPLGVVNRCTDGLVNIILREDADLKLKTLAAMLGYALLVISVESKTFRILEKYIDTAGFLEELLSRVFSEENLEFSAVCSKLLAFIIHHQGNSSFRRAKSLTISAQSLADLLLRTRKSPRASINGMHFTMELFSQCIDGSAIRLEEIANVQNAIGVINLYEALHIIHGRSDPTQMNVVYQCLSEILKFSYERVETLSYQLCASMSNSDLVTSTLNSRLLSCEFYNFVSIWLRYRKRSCSDEGSWNVRSLRKTPFEETLERVKKHVDTIKEEDATNAYYNLRYALSEFEE